MNTGPWFRQVNLEHVVRNIRFSVACTSALRGSLIAFRALQRHMQKSNTAEWEVLGALFNSGVVQYAKPFLNANTKYGERRLRNPRLDKQAGFDRHLHREMLDLRNQLVAHHDQRSYDADIVLQYLAEQVGDTAVPLMVVNLFAQVAHANCVTTSEAIDHVCTHVEVVVQDCQLALWRDLAILNFCLRNRPDGLSAAQAAGVKVSAILMPPGVNHVQAPTIDAESLQHWGYSMDSNLVRTISFVRHGYHIAMDGSGHVSADLIELAE